MDAYLNIGDATVVLAAYTYVGVTFSPTTDAPMTAEIPSNFVAEDEQQTLDDKLINVGFPAPLPPASNMPVSSIWGHPNDVSYMPGNSLNQSRKEDIESLGGQLKARTLQMNNAEQTLKITKADLETCESKRAKDQTDISKQAHEHPQLKKHNDRLEAKKSELQRQLDSAETETCTPSRDSNYAMTQLGSDGTESLKLQECEEGRQRDGLELESERDTTDAQKKQIETFSQELDSQRMEYAMLYTQYQQIYRFAQNQTAALSEARVREEQLQDSLNMAEHENSDLQERIEQLERNLPSQETAEEDKIRRKQEDANAQYAKVLQEQIADLKLELEKLTASRPNGAMSESEGDGAIDAAYGEDQRAAMIDPTDTSPENDEDKVTKSEGIDQEGKQEPDTRSASASKPSDKRTSSLQHSLVAGSAKQDVITAGGAAPETSSFTTTGTPPPLNRDLNTLKLPLRTFPEENLPGRQGMGGTRAVGPQLNLTQSSAQQDMYCMLNSPALVKTSPKTAGSLDGSIHAGNLEPPRAPRTGTNRTPAYVPSSQSTTGTSHHMNTATTLPYTPRGPAVKNTCRLCGTTFTDTEAPKWSFRQDHLHQCRAWKNEWEPKRFVNQNGDPKYPPHWKNQRTLQPAVDPPWLVSVQKLQNERYEKMRKAFLVEGVTEAAFLRGTYRQADADTEDQGKTAVMEISVKGEVEEGNNRKPHSESVMIAAIKTNPQPDAKTEPIALKEKTSAPEIEPSSSDQKPLIWGDDKYDGSFEVGTPTSWLKKPRPISSTQSTSQKSDNKSTQNERVAPPAPSPAPIPTPSSAPASATLASTTSPPPRNEVLVKVGMNTPQFLPASVRSITRGGLRRRSRFFPTQSVSPSPVLGAGSPTTTPRAEHGRGDGGGNSGSRELMSMADLLSAPPAGARAQHLAPRNAWGGRNRDGSKGSLGGDAE